MNFWKSWKSFPNEFVNFPGITRSSKPLTWLSSAFPNPAFPCVPQRAYECRYYRSTSFHHSFAWGQYVEGHQHTTWTGENVRTSWTGFSPSRPPLHLSSSIPPRRRGAFVRSRADIAPLLDIVAPRREAHFSVHLRDFETAHYVNAKTRPKNWSNPPSKYQQLLGGVIRPAGDKHSSRLTITDGSCCSRVSSIDRWCRLFLEFSIDFSMLKAT